jgi:hypothetical protein
MFVVLDWLNWVDPKEELTISNVCKLDRYLQQLSLRPSISLDLEYEENQFKK